MSRTRKDRPYRVIVREMHDAVCDCPHADRRCPKRRLWRRGWPGPFNGAWRGISRWATAWWRAHRRRAHVQLRQGREPLELPRPRHAAR